MWDKFLYNINKKRRELPERKGRFLGSADKWLSGFLDKVNKAYYSGFLINYQAWFGDLERLFGVFEWGHRTHDIVVNYYISVFSSMRVAMHEFAHLAEWTYNGDINHGLYFCRELERMGIGLSRFEGKEECYLIIAGRFYQARILGFGYRSSWIYCEIPSFNKAYGERMILKDCVSTVYTKEEVEEIKNVNNSVVFPGNYFLPVIEATYFPSVVENIKNSFPSVTISRRDLKKSNLRIR